MILHPLAVPVEPDAGEATDWLVGELSKPEYARAKPTLLDIIGQAISDWLQGVLSGAGDAPPLLAIGIATLIVIAIVVVALIFGGRARLVRRASPPTELFGADERRSARELRAAAEAAARRGDWIGATTDAYRAIARDAAERELVVVTPGLTARAFASGVADRFPDESAALARAADAFDAVRYLGSAGTEAAYRDVAALGSRLRAARPAGVVV